MPVTRLDCIIYAKFRDTRISCDTLDTYINYIDTGKKVARIIKIICFKNIYKYSVA